MTPILVDTSVWRRYFAGTGAFAALGDLLDEDEAVLTHRFVVGELVMGGLSAEEEELFERLPSATTVSHEEVLAFVRLHQLARRGIGWIDGHLLASAAISAARLWTAHRALAREADRLGFAFALGRT